MASLFMFIGLPVGSKLPGTANRFAPASDRYGINGGSALGSTAVAALEAPLFVDQCFLVADGALLAFGLGLVGQVTLERALYPVLPSVDGLAVPIES